MMPRKVQFLGVLLLAAVLVGVSFATGYLVFNRHSTGAFPSASTENVATPAAALPVAATSVAPDTPPAARGLVITNAIYGDLPNGSATDVTAKVASLVSDGALNLTVGNDLFGDPAPGVEKKLRVEYTVDGVPASKIVPEYHAMHLLGRAGPVRLVIIKASYGDLPNGAATDVTRTIADMVDGDALSVAASNDAFGDPAVGIEKKLRVDYRFDGAEKTKTVSEGETLVISNLGF